MGHVRNSNRNKRKYGDSRKAKTAANKTRKQEKEAKRQAKFAERRAKRENDDG